MIFLAKGSVHAYERNYASAVDTLFSRRARLGLLVIRQGLWALVAARRATALVVEIAVIYAIKPPNKALQPTRAHGPGLRLLR